MGFNGMEKNDEVIGEGASYSTTFRQFDPRLCRWLSLDPAMTKYPSQSPYLAFNNNPLFFTDSFGDEPPEGFVNLKGANGKDIWIPGDAQVRMRTAEDANGDGKINLK